MNKNLSYPRLCALCGTKPTKLSQSMHNAGFEHLGLPFKYVAFDTEDTKSAIEFMRSFGLRGYSLTIPHKVQAMALVDEVDENAQPAGAINTVINDTEKLKGYNTDIFGITESLRESNVISLKGKRILLLGAGGASRAALCALAQLGAEDICIANRTKDKAETLAKEFSASAISYKELTEKGIKEFDLIINTAPFGSKLMPQGTFSYPFELSEIRSEQIIFDAVTNKTGLTHAAENATATVVYGSRMLLFQAVKQFELFTNEQAPVAIMQQALDKALADN